MSDPDWDDFLDDCEHFEYAWKMKAKKNIDKWGVQSPGLILRCMIEELGELSQAQLQNEFEDGDPQRIHNELGDLIALCYQLKFLLYCDDYE